MNIEPGKPSGEFAKPSSWVGAKNEVTHWSRNCWVWHRWHGCGQGPPQQCLPDQPSHWCADRTCTGGDLDIAKDRGVALAPGVLTSEIDRVLMDPNIDIVIELIGGYDTAKRVILDAIAAGKHVVTANKALLALHGEEIFEAVTRKGVELGFEAGVGGGIPVIRALTEGLAGNTIESIYGIINGTSNYFCPE